MQESLATLRLFKHMIDHQLLSLLSTFLLLSRQKTNACAGKPGMAETRPDTIQVKWQNIRNVF